MGTATLKKFNPKGKWRIIRLICHDGGGQARFFGFANFTKRDDTALDYHEYGRLRTAAGRFDAHQHYIWVIKEGGFDICFSNGRAFHSFNFDTPRAEHLCVNDLYKTRYNFINPDQFKQNWRVDGPNKSYSLFSRFTRVASS